MIPFVACVAIRRLGLDIAGVVAKQASAKYTPEATTWVKIKNRQYSQAVGREDFFQSA